MVLSSEMVASSKTSTDTANHRAEWRWCTYGDLGISKKSLPHDFVDLWTAYRTIRNKCHLMPTPLTQSRSYIGTSKAKTCDGVNTGNLDSMKTRDLQALRSQL